MQFVKKINNMLISATDIDKEVRKQKTKNIKILAILRLVFACI